MPCFEYLIWISFYDSRDRSLIAPQCQCNLSLWLLSSRRSSCKQISSVFLCLIFFCMSSAGSSATLSSFTRTCGLNLCNRFKNTRASLYIVWSFSQKLGSIHPFSRNKVSITAAPDRLNIKVISLKLFLNTLTSLNSRCNINLSHGNLINSMCSFLLQNNEMQSFLLIWTVNGMKWLKSGERCGLLSHLKVLVCYTL